MDKYLIFDVNCSLCSPHVTVEAKSNSDAAKRYCLFKYPLKEPKRSGSKFVEISAQLCKIIDGKPFIVKGKRKTWFELVEISF